MLSICIKLLSLAKALSGFSKCKVPSSIHDQSQLDNHFQSCTLALANCLNTCFIGQSLPRLFGCGLHSSSKEWVIKRGITQVYN